MNELTLNDLDILQLIPNPNISGKAKGAALKAFFGDHPRKDASKLKKSELENIIIFLMDYVDFDDLEKNPVKWKITD